MKKQKYSAKNMQKNVKKHLPKNFIAVRKSVYMTF